MGYGFGIGFMGLGLGLFGIGIGFMVWVWVGVFSSICALRVLRMIVFQYIALRVIKIGLFPVSQHFQGP